MARRAQQPRRQGEDEEQRPVPLQVAMVVRGRDGGGDAGVVQAAGAGLWGLWVCVGVEIRGWLGRLGAAALCSVPAHHIEFLMYN